MSVCSLELLLSLARDVRTQSERASAAAAAAEGGALESELRPNGLTSGLAFGACIWGLANGARSCCCCSSGGGAEADDYLRAHLILRCRLDLKLSSAHAHCDLEPFGSNVRVFRRRTGRLNEPPRPLWRINIICGRTSRDLAAAECNEHSHCTTALALAEWAPLVAINNNQRRSEPLSVWLLSGGQLTLAQVPFGGTAAAAAAAAGVVRQQWSVMSANMTFVAGQRRTKLAANNKHSA